MCAATVAPLCHASGPPASLAKVSTPQTPAKLSHMLSLNSHSAGLTVTLSPELCVESVVKCCVRSGSLGVSCVSLPRTTLSVWAASVVIYSTVVSAHGGRRSAGRLGGLFVVAHLRRLNLYFSRPHACGSSCGSRSSTPYSRGSRPHARRSTHTYKASPTRAQLRWSQAAAPWLLVRAPHWLYTSCGHKSP